MKVLSFRTAAFAAALPVYFLLHLKQFLHVVINTSSITFGYASTSAPIQINSTDIETVLIIATVPYSANHVMTLWTQLECVTDGIDRVLISAPDASWSKEIIAHVIKRFTQLSNSTAFRLEATFNLNNRYDVGLWCDGIDYIKAQNTWVTSTDVPRAVFLINDSAAALRRYDELTNRVVAATQIEQRNRTDTAGGSVKLISLNGDLIVPRRHKTWVESVYRGLTPNGASIFYQHSCTSENQRACVGKRGGINKDCIVMHYEQALARSYLPAELETMFPSYFFPESWNTSIWETTNGPIRRREHWLQGKQFFWFLYEVHNFPFRKLKWPDGPPPPESQCLELLGGKPQFDELPYPSDDALKDYQAEMLDLDWLL